MPTSGERSLAAASAPGRFDLVGVRWHGSGSVHFSVRAAGGRWGPWLDAAPEEEDRPDAGSREAAPSRGWRLGNPTWVGPADRDPLSDHRARAGPPCHVRAQPGAEDPPARALPRPVLRRSCHAAPGAPTSRSCAGTPVYAPAIRFASVHHTAGPNGYSPAQVAAIMRGIQVYHVKSNGWNDIGYNFLVDRYGTVYEGRYGRHRQERRRRAHHAGFNTGSVGVAVIGTFGASAAPGRGRDRRSRSCSRGASTSPTSTRSPRSPCVSGGSERYVSGTPVDAACGLGPPRHRAHLVPR